MSQKNRKIHEVCSSAILVRNNKLVLLHDHNKKHYVLPQGHKRKKEALPNAAIREAREETGFQSLSREAKQNIFQFLLEENY